MNTRKLSTGNRGVILAILSMALMLGNASFIDVLQAEAALALDSQTATTSNRATVSVTAKKRVTAAIKRKATLTKKSAKADLTSTPFPPPELLTPIDGFAHAGRISPAFSWSYTGQLGPNQYFLFWIEHKSGVDVQCLAQPQALARDYIPILAFPNNKPFNWSVKVVSLQKPLETEGEACEGTDVTTSSPMRSFFWPQEASDVPKAEGPATAVCTTCPKCPPCPSP